MAKLISSSQKNLTLAPLTWRIITMVTGLLVLAVVLAVRSFLTYTNILANNPNWTISKTQLYFPGHDGATFRDYPPAVAQQSLNLAAWRGYHEVLTENAFNWNELNFKFSPENHSYLYVIFDHSDEVFNAVRISLTPLYRSAIITAKYSGEFVSQTPLPALPFTEKQWQTVNLRHSARDPEQYEFWMNGARVNTFRAPATQPGTVATKIGFRSGQKPILVDSVALLDANQKVIFSEKFDHQANFWRYAMFVVITTLAVHRIIFLLLRSNPTRVKKYFQAVFVLSFFVILFTSTALLLQQPIRNRYPNFGHWWYRLMKGPTNTANSYLANKVEWVFDAHPPEKAPQTKRVLMIGSSQIDGEGAGRFGEDIPSRLQKLLDEKLTTPTKKWEVINAGVSGHTAAELVEVFEYQWLKLQPDLIIINLSSNDQIYGEGDKPMESFGPSLQKFIDLAKKHQVKIAFSAEANAIESLPKLEAHAIMRDLATKNQILFLDTHGYIAEQTDKGILWWDFVHMTSFGYQLVSEYFFNQLQPILKNL